ncbi:hypothetical protein ACVWWG_007625 [Bradyrhizobium sp. LB7.2]
MCLVPSIPDPKLPPETQAMKEPDGAAVRSSTSRRMGDQARASSANTILTSGSGVTAAAPTQAKTLLGQ